ncbi:MAG: hypothetical protein LBK13_00480 [Spirochaetales bacterium]|jgi:hypothetical protein|nr:hypothetical protein [Spirochaetales bacterium]
MVTYYTFPDSDVAYAKIIENFEFLVNEYDYKISSHVINKFHVKIIYENTHAIIEICNATNYTDYGFSIFVQDIQTAENKLIINIPYEKEDKECDFIKTSSEYLHSNYAAIIKFLPEDILNRIRDDFRKKRENAYIKNKLLTVYSKNVNIGAEQLMRSILVIANGRKDVVDKIFDENFYNDPRDVLMEAMNIDNTINYGLNKFKK